MHRQRIAILIASAAGMLGTFLPWVNIPLMGSLNGTGGDGWITFGLFGVAFLITFLGNKTLALKGVYLALGLISGVIAGAIGVWKILDFNSSIGRTAPQTELVKSFGKLVSVGFGLYLIVVAGIAVLLSGILLRKSKT